MKLNIYQKVCSFLFVSVIFFHIWISVLGLREGFFNDLYSLLIGIIPLVIGIIAMNRFRLWSGFKSSVGKAVFFIGLGLFSWGVGEIIWSYYNFFVGVPAPYPSIADIFFAPSVFFYGLGAFYFSGVTGVRFGFKNNYVRILTILVSVAVLFISYYLLIIVARHGMFISKGGSPIKTILDIAYPLGDFFGLLLAVITSGLSYKYLGGKYKYDVFAILLGIATMFVGDAIFSYTTTVGTFYNGNFGDFVLSLGIFLLSFGVLGFCKLKSNLLENI